MPSPNETDRERLLRLIDGGPEVVKEVQEERKPAAVEEEKKPAAAPVTPTPVDKRENSIGSAKAFLGQIRWDTATVVKSVLAVVLLILGLRAASDFLRSSWKSENESGVSSAVSVSKPEDDSGVGLRLVGVDWGEPAVALLEDLKTGKTYFARKDDKIKQTRVKEIFKDKVIVVIHGKTLELR